MATKKAITEFVEDEEIAEVPAPEPLVLTKDEVSARVKGTWTLFYAQASYDFVDGTRYKLSRDLYEYLKRSGNIYDTL